MGDPGYYRPKAGIVEAMFYRETKASAYQILAWVHENSGTGQLMQSYPDHVGRLVIEGIDVDHGMWVVKENGSFKIMTDNNFTALYEPTIKPHMRSASGGGGAGGGFIG